MRSCTCWLSQLFAPKYPGATPLISEYVCNESMPRAIATKAMTMERANCAD